MELVAAAPSSGGVPPFHDHDVREWSRIDSLTGVLERARLETDHWTANTNNSRHKYGKVVDSRARTNADGALQQQARRQLEVFQSQIPGGHLQVIKTQTVSSSRWSSSNKSTIEPSKAFEHLQLTANPLDLSSQKSKAIVGRGVGRRPPSRPRAREESIGNPLRTAQENLYRVSRLCHQIHENAVRQTLGNERLNGTELLNHTNLTRTKSTSSEELHFTSDDKSTRSSEDLEDLEQLQNWRRTSKLRRSLQYPKPSKPAPKPQDLPENSGSVRKIREELEKGRRLSTALRGNNVDLEALDQILQTISNSSSEKNSTCSAEEDTNKKKRNSFVTVETLQEVRGRLRRTSSSTDDTKTIEEDTDDGIVTEEMPAENVLANPASRVRSYVYGMENTATKNPVLGTGSLESRTKLLNGSTHIRNEDWYNRRKSYGFEQVHNAEPSSPVSLRTKGRVESSTDSGICRSSEMVEKNKFVSDTEICDSGGKVKQISSIFDKDVKSTTITIPIVAKSPWLDAPDKDIKRHSIAVDESKYVLNGDDTKYRRTSLTINPSIDDLSQNRRLKKVEFCKTEVHFAAESGKVNIVATDDKPPPTNNFRRRRRNSGPILDSLDRNNLPMLHFGDTSYEKLLLGLANDELEDDTASASYGTVTVNTNANQIELFGDDKKDYNESVKGILKNKPIKPTPYHLGEDQLPFSDSEKWGVKLKPVQKPTETPFWKSTVTLHNTVYPKSEETEKPEFQMRLQTLKPIENKPDLLNHQNDVKFVTGSDNRKLWAVADRVKLTEETTENKIYSTKVNFGDNGTAVIENDHQSDQEMVWPKKGNPISSDYNSLAEAAEITNTNTSSKSCRISLKDTNYSSIKTSAFLPSAHLSSPSLVGRNSNKIDPKPDDFLNAPDPKLHHQKVITNVLRTPKKSEMTYFGLPVSPQPIKNHQSVIHKETKLSEKPDLLQHSTPKSKNRDNDNPIYENVKNSEFDSKILEELTKAADEILQAVNGFTDDDEENSEEQAPLETISETKSWKQPPRKIKEVPPKTRNTKAVVKNISSNSSVDSLSRDPKKLARVRKPLQCTPVASKMVSQTTKARRLQRANSREALLQSHGSSSEDLGANLEAPQRKPRQIKKTKLQQMSMNGFDIQKKAPSSTRPSRKEEDRTKSDNRSAEPAKEIRHKTAVSTIRSTAEKSSRDRSKGRVSETKSRLPAQRKIPGSNLSARDPKKTVPSREISGHRISTANIKKCQRADGGSRH